MSSYTPQVKAALTEAGCVFVLHGRGDHEVWRSPINGKQFTVDGKILSRHTANGTLRDAGLPRQF